MAENKSKKSSRKKKLIFWISIFFFLYISVFFILNNKTTVGNSNGTDKIVPDGSRDKTLVERQMEQKEVVESKKSLYQRFTESRKIYIGDNKVSHIRVDGLSLDNFDRAMSNFIKIRKPDSTFNPIYNGKSSNGVEFFTDFSYFELRAENRKEYFKIPISEKLEFQNMYRKLIYTSVEFITNEDRIGSVKVLFGNDTKKIWFWKKKDLINKILYKREVGKIQPEKEFAKTKENYTVKLDKSGVEITIQTMGKDFIRVSCGDNMAYYEVYPNLYEYLHTLFN